MVYTVAGADAAVYIDHYIHMKRRDKSMNKKMNNKGFSLVELIIVIAIMVILVGALAPQFFKVSH